jgi:hypothetical protein
MGPVKEKASTHPPSQIPDSTPSTTKTTKNKKNQPEIDTK